MSLFVKIEQNHLIGSLQIIHIFATDSRFRFCIKILLAILK